MSTRIDVPTKIAQVQMGELRVRVLGPSPQCMAKIVLMDSEGMQVADTVFSAFSGETWKRLKALEKSIESDFIAVLESPEQVSESSSYEFSG